jgi:hypothetical protein
VVIALGRGLPAVGMPPQAVTSTDADLPHVPGIALAERVVVATARATVSAPRRRRREGTTTMIAVVAITLLRAAARWMTIRLLADTMSRTAAALVLVTTLLTPT